MSNTAPQRRGGSGAAGHSAAAFSCDVVIVAFSVPPDKEVPLHFKQLLNPIHISKELSL